MRAMSRSKPKAFDDLPLFAGEAELAEVFMGPGKTSEWRQFAALLEPRGLPRIDALMGGRYRPAVKAFFDKEYGLTTVAPRTVPDGPEKLGTWSSKKDRVRRV
jgi:hypothetical protein